MLDAQLLAGFPPQAVPEANGIAVIHYCCAIAAHADGLELEYEFAAYSKFTVVPGAAQAVDFITAKFPLP